MPAFPDRQAGTCTPSSPSRPGPAMRGSCEPCPQGCLRVTIPDRGFHERPETPLLQDGDQTTGLDYSGFLDPHRMHTGCPPASRTRGFQCYFHGCIELVFTHQTAHPFKVHWPLVYTHGCAASTPVNFGMSASPQRGTLHCIIVPNALALSHRRSPSCLCACPYSGQFV